MIEFHQEFHMANERKYNHMKKILIIFLITIANQVVAQQWQKLDGALIRHRQIQLKAYQAAQQKNWTLLDTLNGGARLLVGLNKNGLPLYDVTTNLHSFNSIGNQHLVTGGKYNLNLSGQDINIGLWDGALAYIYHQEFNNRVKEGESDFTLAHSTHVAGTIAGKGVDEKARGMASSATVLSYNMSSDFLEMNDEARRGMILSNHSYGGVAGWNWDGYKGAWVWHGDHTISADEDYKFGYYNQQASTWDAIAYEYPNYLMVKAAGNSRGFGDGVEAGNFLYMTDEGAVLAEPDMEPFPVNGPYDCIPTHSVAKNILTVGAINKTDYLYPTSVSSAYFSSWGPADDGRIKPDIVTEGVDIYSCTNSGYKDYELQSGTSMAAPAATGSIALLQEYHKNTYGSYMSSSLCKAVVIHSAKECGTATGPDYAYGWGLLDTEAAIPLINKTEADIIQLDIEELVEFEVDALGSEPLKLTMVWTDPAHDAMPEELDNRTPVLINDMDVRIYDELGNEFYPWVLDVENPALPATKGDNVVDNVEQIVIDNPAAGKYRVVVSYKNTLQEDKQRVSIVINGIDTSNDLSVVSEINIDGMDVGEASEGTFIIKNPSDQPINNIDFAYSSAIEILNTVDALNAQSETEIKFKITPPANGYIDEKIKITYNDKQLKTVRVRGYVEQFELSYTDELDFGEVKYKYTGSKTLNIKVVGNQDLVVENVILPEDWSLGETSFVVNERAPFSATLKYKPVLKEEVDAVIILETNRGEIPITRITASCSDGLPDRPDVPDVPDPDVTEDTFTIPYVHPIGVEQIDGISSISIKNGLIAYAGRNSGNVYVKSTDNEKVKFIELPTRVEEVQFSDDYLLIAQYNDSSVAVYDNDNLEEVRQIKLEGRPMQIKIANNTAYVATLDNNAYKINLDDFSLTHIPELSTGKGSWITPITPYNARYFSKNDFIVSKDGRFCASFLDEIRIYDAQNDEVFIYEEERSWTYGNVEKWGINDKNQLYYYAFTLEYGENISMIDLETQSVRLNYNLRTEMRTFGYDNILYFDGSQTKLIIPSKGSQYALFDTESKEIERIIVYDREIYNNGYYAGVVSSQENEDYIYYADNYGHFVRINKKKPEEFIHTHDKSAKSVFLGDVYDANAIVGYDLITEKEIVCNFSEETIVKRRTLESDIDAPTGAKVTNANDKVIAVYNFSQNISINEIRNSEIKPGVVINLSNSIDNNYALYNLALSKDDRYAYVPLIGGKEIKIVDLETYAVSTIETNAICGQCIISNKGDYLYVVVGDDIAQFRVNGKDLSVEQKYAGAFAHNVYTTAYIEELQKLDISNNDQFIYYHNNRSKSFVKLNVQTGEKDIYNTLMNTADFVLNDDKTRAIVVTTNLEYCVLNTEEELIEIKKTANEDIDNVANLYFNSYTNEFNMIGHNLNRINTETGEVIIEEIPGLDGQKAWYDKTGLISLVGLSFNELDIPEYWVTKYKDIYNQDHQTFSMSMPKVEFRNPFNDELVFLTSLTENYFVLNTGTKQEKLVEDDFNWIVYPNPTDNMINIQFDEPQSGMLELYNVNGVKVYSKSIDRTIQISESLSFLKDGVYYLKFKGEKESMYKNIIKY